MIKATAINDESGEVVELRKKDAHALGLLCYVESELTERMARYCRDWEGMSILDKITQEIATEVCGDMLAEYKDILDDVALAMINEARGK